MWGTYRVSEGIHRKPPVDVIRVMAGPFIEQSEPLLCTPLSSYLTYGILIYIWVSIIDVEAALRLGKAVSYAVKKRRPQAHWPMNSIGLDGSMG